jgi:hypothetical protein
LPLSFCLKVSYSVTIPDSCMGQLTNPRQEINMGTTTFSGPIKAGTIKETTGTTLGSNIKNTGQVVMSQTFAADLSGGALAAQVTDH